MGRYSELGERALSTAAGQREYLRKGPPYDLQGIGGGCPEGKTDKAGVS